MKDPLRGVVMQGSYLGWYEFSPLKDYELRQNLWELNRLPKIHSEMYSTKPPIVKVIKHPGENSVMPPRNFQRMDRMDIRLHNSAYAGKLFIIVKVYPSYTFKGEHCYLCDEVNVRDDFWSVVTSIEGRDLEDPQKFKKVGKIDLPERVFANREFLEEAPQIKKLLESYQLI